MANWYMKGQSNYDNSTGFHMALYLDMDGYPEGDYNGERIQADAETGDPFLAVGIKSIDWSQAQARIEIGLIGDHVLSVSEDGAVIPLENDLSADEAYCGDVLNLTHSVGFGLPVHISGNNAGALADADSLADMPAIGLSVGTNKVLTRGVIRDTGWSWTANDKIYVTTSGTLSTTHPSGTGDIVQCIAVAISATELLVDRWDWVKHN